MNLTTATPSEIDTEIAPIYVRYYDVLRKVATYQGYAEGSEDTLARIDAGTYRYPTTEYGIAKMREVLAEQQAKVAALREEARAIMAETAPHEAEYIRRGGWTRFYLVDNPTGHVHSSRACSTCFPTTAFVWLPDYSGADEATLVAAAGEAACTMCFPTAPVDVLRRRSTIEAPARAAARIEREAAKAARDAAKAAKAITAADGSPLRIEVHGRAETLSTEVAARQWLVGHIADHRAHGYKLSADAVGTVTAALAAKAGVTVEDMTATVESKVAAKIRRDAR